MDTYFDFKRKLNREILKQMFVISCFLISLYSQNVDFSDTLKFPLGTTSFKTFNEQHVGLILEEKEGEKNLTNKISKKNMAKYYFDKQEKLKFIIFLLMDYSDSIRISTINNLTKKYAKGTEKGNFSVSVTNWKNGKYEIMSSHAKMAKLWILILSLNAD